MHNLDMFIIVSKSLNTFNVKMRLHKSFGEMTMDKMCLKALEPFDIHIAKGEIIPHEVQTWLTSTGRTHQYLESGKVALGVVN